MPRFIVKNGPKRQPQNRGCVSCIFGFFFLNFFVIFPLFLLISCCFIPSWNPQTAHQMRLQAKIYFGVWKTPPIHTPTKCRPDKLSPDLDSYRHLQTYAIKSRGLTDKWTTKTGSRKGERGPCRRTDGTV